MLDPVQYMRAVAEAIATYGHRGVIKLENAASLANQNLRIGYSDGVILQQAKLVQESLKEGVHDYRANTPTHLFDVAAAHEFEELTRTEIALPQHEVEP